LRKRRGTDNFKKRTKSRGSYSHTGVIKPDHVSPSRAIEEDEARSLLMGQTIRLVVGNPLLLAAMNLLEFFRGKVLWAVTCEKFEQKAARLDSCMDK
jgi:hypothetical protein